MNWLVAEFLIESEPGERRRKTRRTLRLMPDVALPDSDTAVVMLDLSEAGMLLNTEAEFEVGEVLQVDLPDFGIAEARVVWKRKPLHGCEFLSPITKAAISAMLLRSGGEADGQ